LFYFAAVPLWFHWPPLVRGRVGNGDDCGLECGGQISPGIDYTRQAASIIALNLRVLLLISIADVRFLDAMSKRALIILLVASTLVALALTRFWALAPFLTPLGYIHPPNWTDADVVRAIWHFRLVSPEWGNRSLDYEQWCEVETCARLAVVFLGWFATIKIIQRRYLRTRNNAPSIIVPPSHAAPLG